MRVPQRSANGDAAMLAAECSILLTSSGFAVAEVAPAQCGTGVRLLFAMYHGRAFAFECASTRVTHRTRQHYHRLSAFRSNGAAFAAITSLQQMRDIVAHNLVRPSAG